MRKLYKYKRYMVKLIIVVAIVKIITLICVMSYTCTYTHARTHTHIYIYTIEPITMFVYNNFQVETPASHTSLHNNLIVFFHYVITKCTSLNLKCM